MLIVLALASSSVLMLMCCGGGVAGLLWWGMQPVEPSKNVAQREHQKQSPPKDEKPAQTKDDPRPKEVDSLLEATADEFYSAYEKDLIAADLKYLNKRIRLAKVSGKIEKDSQGRYYLAALKRRAVKQRGGGGLMTPAEAHRRMMEAFANQKYEPAILVYLKADEVAGFRGVKENDVLTIEGRCASTRNDQNTVPAVVVIIEDARLAKVDHQQAVKTAGKEGSPAAKPKTKLEELFSPEEVAKMRAKAEEDFWATLAGKRGTAITLEESNALPRLCEFPDGYKPLLNALDRIPEDSGDRRDYRNSRCILLTLIAPERAGSRAGSKLLSFRDKVPDRLVMRYARLLLTYSDDGICREICSFLRERKKQAKEALPLLKQLYLKGRGTVQERELEVTIKALQEE